MAVITPKPAPVTSYWLRIAVLVLLMCAVMAAFGFWWFAMRVTTQPATTPTTPTVTTPKGQGAVAVSEAGLHTLASLGRSIYWAGPQPDVTYELTQHPDGRVYLRYLPSGTPLGSPKAFLTVASYPVTDAYAVTRSVAVQAGSIQVEVGHGGVAFYRSELPTNVYVAFRGSEYQIEVFDPSPQRARALVQSGAIRAIEGAASGATVPKSAAVAVYPNQLAKLATRLGRPLYWAGRQRNATYELTQTPDGRVYLRYLPPGAVVGSAQPYLTVGTYPVANAYATTKAAASRPGSVRIDVPGGVAFYSKSRPGSVYIAFPGVNEQVEVFDPSAAAVHALVAGRQIRPVS